MLPLRGMGTSWPVFDFNAGASPPMPAAPWQPTHPFSSKSTAPSLAVPQPGGSSSPVGLIEISAARISSAVGGRPTPYVGDDCANAGLPRSSTIVQSLGEPIGHAPIPADPPRHNECCDSDACFARVRAHCRLLLPAR